MKDDFTGECPPLDISEEDVLDAMRQIRGYLDITPGDFREVYRVAYALALERLYESVTAESIMTRQVVTIPQDMELVHAAGLLAEKQISGAPVTAPDGAVAGVVSEKDFLKEMGFIKTPSFMQIATHCLGEKSCMIGRLHNKTVGDIMTQPPITGFPAMRIIDISSLFAKRKINRLPIIDEKMRPVGIVTRTDLAHSFRAFGEGGRV